MYGPYFVRQVRKFNTESSKERCGLVVQNEAGRRIVELKNIHEDPRHHFAMTTRGYRGTFPIKSIFHTHLRTEQSGPSEHDLRELGRLRKKLPDLTGIVYIVPLGLLVEYSDEGPTRRLLIASR